jgi:glycosyltransferase involved in cell wall biosynthesis
MGLGTEIVVVDDGSTDRTRAVVEEACRTNPNVKLLPIDKNQGKAHAVRSGFDAASGDVVMILDADMTVRPEDLPMFFAPIQNGTADFINGTRLIYPMRTGAMRIVNFIGNKIFCLILSWVIRQRVSDTLCGTKVLLKKCIPKMPVTGVDRWGDFDLLFGAARMKLRIKEIPIYYQERKAGKSKMRALKDGVHFAIACIYGWLIQKFPVRFPWKNG